MLLSGTYAAWWVCSPIRKKSSARMYLVVLDQLGNVGAFYTPTEFDCEDDVCAPPPPAVQAWRDKQGQVWSEVGVGPTFIP